MKKVFLFAILLASAAVYGQQGASTLRFDVQTWDFGTINETKGVVSHDFGFTNTGKVPVVVESVEVSCGCTSPTFSRAPVMPGKKGTVTIAYDPKDRPGAFLKEISVITVTGGNNRAVDRLNIKGVVTPRARTVEDDYPFVTLQGVRFSTPYLNFDRVGQGETKSMTVGYINTSRRSAEVKLSDPAANPWFRITSPGMVCAGCKGEITLTFDLRRTTAWGTLTATADIFVDGVKNGYGLQATALATDNFDAVDRKSTRLNSSH